MSGPDPNASQPPEAATARATTAQQQQQQPQPQPQQPRHQPDSAPFQSQLEYLSQTQQQQPPQNVAPYGQQHFDMSSMAGALPGQSPMTSRPYASPDPSQGLASPNPYQQAMYPPTQRGGPRFDPAMMARAQQQQFMGAQYGGPGPMQNMPRQPGFPMQQQVPFSPVDPYAFGINPAQYSPIDPRFGPPGSFVLPAGLPTDIAQFARRGSADTAPIPNFPRGPPRKPKQSGHALWVGNLPPQALVTDLKDHFSRDATIDIESVFLIAKSNCAFVNYRTEAACVAAMNRFHDSRFHGVRLVCRLRRGTASSSAATPTEESTESPPEPATATIETKEEDVLSPTIARSQSHQSDVSNQSTSPAAPAPGEKVLEKYFIVKSLTAQDLEASVRNGIWATQSHNEDALNKAYGQAENVYLIFSANKSGEYFGYARMSSTISGEAVDLSSTFPSAQEAATDPAGSPQSIPTPATATAPKGRIIDDSARGTIFWEADHSEDEEGSPDNQSGGQNWGKQFQIEWLSTNRLPFYRTRGLRNPWNANREVKIARDGTELEPSVGRRLVQMFHRPSPSPSSGGPGSAPPGGGMQYR